MNTLRQAFAAAKAKNKSLFIAYLQAGDPTMDQSVAYAVALAEAGADIIEWGIPFSDPIADGPTNQAASERALASGTSLQRALDGIAALRRKHVTTPIVIFSYLNPIFQMGYDTFAKKATEVGANGVLVVDLPPGEDAAFHHTMDKAGLPTCFLAAPTTPDARLPTINAASTGFVYYVSRTGVTGVGQNLAVDLDKELARVKQHVQAPLVVGFGISTPAHVSYVASRADGVVVGSAIVNEIATHGTHHDGPHQLKKFAEQLTRACR